MSKTKIEVKNWQELNERLNAVSQVARSRAVLDGLIAGANLINLRAKTTLEANKKGASTTGYKYYPTVFKHEQARKNGEDLEAVRTGVWNRQNGYKLRWLEWGTGERYTRKRYNWKKNKQLIPEQYRGKIEGSGFFFNAVRNSNDEVFRVVTDAVLESLGKLSKRGK